MLLKTKLSGLAFSTLMLLSIAVHAQVSPQPLFTGLHPEIFQGVSLANGVTAFRGLPFARPPIGDLRWRPPKPYQPTPGRRIADRFAPACMQGSHTVDWYQDLIRSVGGDPQAFDHPEEGYSEDCLYLNIWSPENASEGELPVMVWIHGGSNKGGWAFEPDYRGAQLAAQGVVVVSVAYRVGLFGFFAHPEMPDEQGGAANYGILDLIAALQWVQKHIAEFGGNKDNVTLFGESAGAANIGYLMSSPVAKGLFHKAIHQSSGSQMVSPPTLAEQAAQGERLAQYADADLSGLRKIAGADLLQLVEQALPHHGYAPAIGGHGLPNSPRSVFTELKQADVPLLIGTNANEWLMYLQPGQQLVDTLADMGISGSADEIGSRFDTLSDELKMDRLITASYMLCPSYDMANAVQGSGNDAWVYQLSRVRAGEHWRSVGAYHGAEIPYVFDTHANWLPTNEADKMLTDAMQRYWVNFARTGDPNDKGEDLPTWPVWRLNEPMVAKLDQPIESRPAPDLWLCDLLSLKAR